MNEIKIVFSDEEAVSQLRNLGATVEERRVERWVGNDCYNAWIWQVKKADGSWTDAIPVFRELVQTGIRRQALNNVNALDLINIIK